MKHILFISNKNRQIAYMKRMAGHEALAGRITVSARRYTGDPVFDEEWTEALASADIVLVTHMGTGLDTRFMQKMAKWLQKHHHRYLMLVEEKSMDGLLEGITLEEAHQVSLYLAHSGEENYVNLMNYLAALDGDGDPGKVTPPKSHPWCGIVGRRGEVYASCEEYEKEYRFDKEEPCLGKVGVLFYRDEWIANELHYPFALFDTLRRNHLEPVLFFSPYMRNEERNQPSLKDSLDQLFGKDQLPLDALIDTCKFSFLSMKAMTLETLKSYDVPVFQAYVMYQSGEEWESSIEGLTPVEVSLSVGLPEMDGSLHGGVIASQETIDEESVYLPIEERVEAVVSRVRNWVLLRKKPNKDKRVAIIFHNYPPSNSNVGSAVGLDSPESVRLLLEAMKDEGYAVDHVPDDSQNLMEEVLAHATNDRKFLTAAAARLAEGHLEVDAYKEFFSSLTEKAKKHIVEDWGEPIGDVFVYDNELLIPGFSNGNVWIGVQPPRGFSDDPNKLYHDPVSAPTHHYEGFYHWLREVWKADAVIHVGTHGNLEWLPGKGTGLSASCYPEMAIQDLPNIYPYWTTIVGEGIQAKRRGAACLVGHLTPPMDQSGLYDAYEELESLLDEYADYKQQKDEAKAEKAGELIIEKAKETHLYDEISCEGLDDLAGKLHELLTDMKYMQMRSGLHILGKSPEGEPLLNFLSGLVRTENGSVPSLPQVLASMRGYDLNELFEHSGEYTKEGRLKAKIINEIMESAKGVLNYAASKDFQMDALGMDELISKVPLISKEGAEKLVPVLEAVCGEYVPNLKKTSQEITSVMRGLEGQYIEPGPGGAPTGGRADVLPTGRNFYGIDERMLPTKTAYEVGRTLADQVIEAFIKEEGRYPEQIGIVLWAGSNTRSHGQCAGQFLNLLGVRPVWQGGSGRIVGLEAIPLSELKRPRIDVTGRISGLIRDMMPSVIRWLDKAVLLVSSLDESPEENFIKKHVAEDAALFEEDGDTPEDAYVKARWRIFGDPAGAYGAGVGAVLEAKNWESIDDLADVYVTWGGYSYSTDRPVTHDAKVFKRRLATMEVTVKNEDNREVSMLSSDDYNAYHGGMIAAVRSLSGKKPMSFVGDSSDSSRVVTRDLQTEIKRIFRSEAANPKYIEGMMKHGYKGAADMANYVAHSYQWDATSDVIDDWMYEELANKYALDAKVQEWMRKVNPWALQRISETLLEAQQRGLWNASEDMKKELQKIYLSIEGTLEEDADD